MEGGAIEAGLVVEERRFVSERVAVGRFEHDDVGAVVGEESGGEGAGHAPREVGDDEAVVGGNRCCVRHSRLPPPPLRGTSPRGGGLDHVIG